MGCVGWVTREWLGRVCFQMFRNLESSKAGWEVPQERQGDSRQRGEGRLPETHGVTWRGPHGTTAGVGSHLQSALLQPAPHCPLQKGGREEEKCLPLQRGSKGNGGPRGVASSPMFSCLHVVAPCPMGSVAAVSGVGTHQERHPTAHEGGVGRQWQVFTAYFSPRVTLWGWGISNSEWPGCFPNVQHVKLHCTGTESGRQEPFN